MTAPTEEALCAEYGVWLAANNFEPQSADELLFEHFASGTMTPEQIAWLRDFIVRWEAWEAAENEARRPPELRSPREVLKSLVVEIEAMLCDDLFGPFDAVNHLGGGAEIEWPNLAILLEEAKASLENYPDLD